MMKLWGERPDGRPFSLGDFMALPISRQHGASGTLFIATVRGWSSSIADFKATSDTLLDYSSDQWRYINSIEIPKNSVGWTREVSDAVGISAAAALAQGVARVNLWKNMVGEGPPPSGEMLEFIGLKPVAIERSFHLCILQFASPASIAVLLPFTQYEKDYLNEECINGQNTRR